MSQPNENAIKPDHAELEAAIADTHVPLSYVLNVCAFMGKELQSIPQAHRKTSVTRLQNKAKLLAEGEPLAALMLTTLAGSWDDFTR